MEPRLHWQTLTPEALAMLGVSEAAYVRPVIHEGRQAYAICSADGTLLAVAESRELAFGIIRQHDLEPVDAN